MAELVITQADGQTTRQRLGTAPLVIGRDAVCDLPINDVSASRRHARIVPSPGGYVVEDLKSKNGTMVNDEACTSRLLRDGDRILLGSTLLVFRDGAALSSASVVVADDPATSHTTHYVSRDQQLLLSKQRLQTILDLSARLTTLQSPDHLFEEAMQVCFDTLHFDRGAIGVRRPKQRLLDWPVVRNLRGAEGELKISRTLLSRALERGERAMFTESGAGRSDPSVSIVQQGIRSALCVPMTHHQDTLGIIYGDRMQSSVPYTNEDIDFLAGIAQQVSIGLVNWRLMEEQRQTARLKHDVELARGIQTRLFPKQLPQFEHLKVAALNDPGQRVSGDYYDVITLPDGRLWFLIADVTGEGVAAAMVMANLQAAVRVTAGETDDPAVLLARWHRLILDNTDAEKFVTCLLALLDPKSGSVRLASAGHPPPLVLRGGERLPEEIRLEPAFPLGLAEDFEVRSITVELGAGPLALFAYTDGVIDAMNTTGEHFGKERLLQALQKADGIDPQSLVDVVREHISEFVGAADPTDDITMLAAWVGPAVESCSPVDEKG